MYFVWGLKTFVRNNQERIRMKVGIAMSRKREGIEWNIYKWLWLKKSSLWFCYMVSLRSNDIYCTSIPFVISVMIDIDTKI